MLSRTNNTRPQSAQQSPIVYSCHSFHRFPNPQAHMVTPTRKPNAMGKAAKTHFEEYGLCVPLLKLGQKRLHARSVGELASKSREGLKVIVKAYADRQASKIIKTLVSKTALAEWIERVETLALGPHPESKLPSTNKAEIIEVLGLTASFSKATDRKVKGKAPSRRPGQKKTTSHASLHPQTAKSEASQKQNSVEPTTGLKEVTQATNKRKYDSAAATEGEQTPAKKTKTGAAPSKTPTSPERAAVTLKTKVVDKAISAPSPALEPTSEDRDDSEEMIEASQPAVSHAEAHRDTELAPPAGEKLETSNSGQYHATDIGDAIYFTFIPAGYDSDACPKCEPEPKRFLKPGHHGRNGHFASDPDLLTGRGHQVDPFDLKLKREYEAKYHAFHTAWPYWPFVNQERNCLASQHVEGKAELDKAEQWMTGYRQKYPGEIVGHLWPCGCEIPRDGDESEEE